MTAPMGRSVQFEKGYDRSAEPNYGVGGMRIRFIYRGDEGAVQFLISTGWVPWEPRPVPTTQYLSSTEYVNRQSSAASSVYPYAADLGYHWPTAHYEDQSRSMQCGVLDGECYYDGSGLNAQPLLIALIYDGEEAMWKQLEDYYAQIASREKLQR